MKNYLILIMLFACSFAACSDDEGDQHATDLRLIEDYLADNALTAESTNSGLHYIITREGTGDHPTLQDEVTVGYRGYLLDGTVFDQTTGGQTITWPLSGFIPGWQEGIPKLKAGGEGTFFIPSRLGYGAQPQPGIPANSVLIFDVQLVSF